MAFSPLSLCLLHFYLLKLTLLLDLGPTLNPGAPPGGSDRKESACNKRNPVHSLDWEDPLEEGMATHSSLFAWEIPWTEELGGLHSMGSQSQTQLSD